MTWNREQTLGQVSALKELTSLRRLTGRQLGPCGIWDIPRKEGVTPSLWCFCPCCLLLHWCCVSYNSHDHWVSNKLKTASNSSRLTISLPTEIDVVVLYNSSFCGVVIVLDSYLFSFRFWNFSVWRRRCCLCPRHMHRLNPFCSPSITVVWIHQSCYPASAWGASSMELGLGKPCSLLSLLHVPPCMFHRVSLHMSRHVCLCSFSCIQHSLVTSAPINSSRGSCVPLWRFHSLTLTPSRPIRFLSRFIFQDRSWKHSKLLKLDCDYCSHGREVSILRSCANTQKVPFVLLPPGVSSAKTSLSSHR